LRKAAEWHNRQILKGMRSGIVAPKKGRVTQDQRTGKGGVAGVCVSFGGTVKSCGEGWLVDKK